MSEVEFKNIESNGISLRLAVQGEGPLVIFCHGWPESWYSYRYQLPIVASAGYKAVAYDVRGYGESDKPHEISEYTMKKLTADVVGIADALGYDDRADGIKWNTDKAKDILIVDDINDSGMTFSVVSQVFKNRHLHFITAALINKEKSGFNVDFYGEMFYDDNWINFPWENK